MNETSEPNTNLGGTSNHLSNLLSQPIARFRALVICSTGLFVLWFFELFLLGGFVSPEVHDLLNWHGYQALIPLPDLVSWLVMVLYLVAAVGLCEFTKAGRMLFSLLTVFNLITSLLGGVQIATAFGSCLGAVTSLADGAILVMAYSSPLAKKFS